MSSGMQSADNPFGTATQYYEGRENPKRKSIAYQAPKGGKDFKYATRSGQESKEFFQNTQEKTYNKF